MHCALEVESKDTMHWTKRQLTKLFVSRECRWLMNYIVSASLSEECKFWYDLKGKNVMHFKIRSAVNANKLMLNSVVRVTTFCIHSLKVSIVRVFFYNYSI